MGAWIETAGVADKNVVEGVAPRVGAWIETTRGKLIAKVDLSHPVWVRGLKHDRQLILARSKNVAPRVGAWIETYGTQSDQIQARSHPVWVRGPAMK